MTLEQAGILIGIAVGVGGLMHTVLLGTTRVAKMEVKVDTLWEFLMRRAGVEAVNRGMATINSPFTITPQALEKMKAMQSELRKLYATFTKPVKDTDLMFEIERQLGARITKEFCVPNNHTLGECLIVAAAIAKDSDTIVVPDSVAVK